MRCLRPASITLLVAVLGMPPSTAAQQPTAESWAAVDSAIGRAGRSQPGGVQRYGFPRADLRVTLDGLQLKPTLALGSWVAFKRDGGHTIAMGDLVLLETEVAPVITKLHEMGVRQTALHNHLQRESPSVMYLHIEGDGDAVAIGRAVRSALELTGTPPAAAPAPTAPIQLDTTQVASIIGQPGAINGGVYQLVVPRAETIRAHGMEIPPSMGVGTVINFQPVENGKAAITGDFVLTGEEVAPVIKELNSAGIAVTALHSHMLSEEPRLFFMHFWAVDDALKLARGLRAALARTGLRH